MQFSQGVLMWCIKVLMVSAMASAIEVREPDEEVPLSELPAALTATEPTDNGMAVGEAPEIFSTASHIANQQLKDLANTDHDLVTPGSLPLNHKNYSEASLEIPPFMKEYNKYQQQYKEYYEQKNQFAAAALPFRFEDALPQKNRVVTDGLSAYGEDSHSESQTEAGQESHPRHKPFPYAYEGHVDTPNPSAYPIPDNLESAPSENIAPTGQTFFSSLSAPFMNWFGPAKPKASEIHAHRFDGSVGHKDKMLPWKRIAKLLSTALPFGILLATLTPNLIVINSTTEDNKPSRLRTDRGARNQDPLIDPLVELVQKYGGLEAMDKPECEDRFFCEMSVMGDRENSNIIQKGFWYLAKETPEHIAQEVGMQELFEAIRGKKCDAYKCPERIPEKESPEERREKEPERTKSKKDEKKTRKFKKFIRS